MGTRVPSIDSNVSVLVGLFSYCQIFRSWLLLTFKSNTILESGAIHNPENVSGHSPIYVKVDLEKANNPPEKICRNPMLNWASSSAEQGEIMHNI